MESMMIMSVSEAKNMMEFDKGTIHKKIRTVNAYLKNNPNDKNAIKKLDGLKEALRMTDEYIENYKQIEKLIPVERREHNELFHIMNGGMCSGL